MNAIELIRMAWREQPEEVVGGILSLILAVLQTLVVIQLFH